jgi:putative tributyrin esterase
MSVLQIHLYSDTLKLQMEVWAILPDARAFDAPDRKYKVLWLMPSGSCDCTDWIRHSDIERMALARNLAVILPGMHRSCCTNMAMGPKYGDWAALELPAAQRRMLPLLSPRREDNFVAGFSNGGYGCFYLAMNYPQVYGAAAGLSAGDKADVDWSTRDWATKVPVFGEGDLHQTHYSYQYAAAQLVQNGQSAPRIFHACGSENPWLYMNHMARDFFQSYCRQGDPFQYQYFEVEGYGHSFAMCEIALDRFFDVLALEKTF